MSFRHSMAVNLTPLLLRLALGAVFIWAGYSKVFYKDAVVGDEARQLARAGLIEVTPAGETVNPDQGPEPPIEGVAPEAVEPADPAPEVDPAPDPADKVEEAAEEAGEAIEEAAEEAGEAIDDALDGEGPTVAEREAAGELGDFSEPVEVVRTVKLGGAIQAAIDRDQWPGFLSSSGAIKALAWSVGLTELLCGVMILIGLLTRLSALGLSGVMIGALWMTQVGPALAGPEPAFLGFLPHPQLEDPSAWVSAWQPMLFQFTLLMAALGVFFSGAGNASVDGIIFREKRQRARSDD